jgi:hypothetical protein
MNKKEVMQQTTGEAKALMPDTPADQQEMAPAARHEVKLEADERTPEEAGYGYGV